MKKTFHLAHPKLTVARHVDAIKHEVKKYLKRERNKALPENADFWDFDCRFGDDEASSVAVHPSEINKKISQVEAKNQASFYLEIIAKPGYRAEKSD
ncbi:DUF6172 family protein [Amphritea sp. 1_MG-2023]|uniref:DUF6172 family protein n=1 Tax=Amphritea sp. 1_MG-2023 TaxID=3062670 RepID=UPI0026E2861C|nr:DUF6172 family protein [Amphritea sp. 1_MG-2023]MDO6564300.1 DUF6172 family protein [Amphritea sp. 1_MG-2023]